MSLTLSPDVLKHVVDVHCHPTDAVAISNDAMEQLGITICAMSSMKSDQNRVAELATSHPDKVVPCFGYHPWFSHLISLDVSLSKEEHYRRLFIREVSNDKPSETEALNRLLEVLPEPTPLTSILDEIREHLTQFPSAMVGEVGLDRVFRVPYDYFAENRELSPFTIPLSHQVAILEGELELAIQFERNVSVHSVKSQQATLELFRKMAKKHGKGWYRISIDMHSCGFSPEMWRDTEKSFPNIFLSLSTVINSRHSNCRKLVQACASDRLLVESDFNNVELVTERTLEMIQLVAEVKGWHTETVWTKEVEGEGRGVVRRLEDNWNRFKKGRHQMPESNGRRKKKVLESDSGEDADQ